MKLVSALKSLFLVVLCGLAHHLVAQAGPTARQSLHISVFAGGTGTYTGLGGGRNLAFTAGGDLSFRRFFSLEPSLEVRGTYPVYEGHIDSQKNVLGGLKLAKEYARFHPYVDLLFGRGQINYRGGLPTPDGRFLYFQSVTNVFSPGFGVDIDLDDHFAFKADAQLQHYNVPVVPNGRVYAKSGTLGIVYRFDFNHRAKENRRRHQDSIGSQP